jgi:acyl CoA:acetate/3-ketoacid CoA transferase
MRSLLDKPVVTADEAARLVRDAQTVAIGGSGAGHAIPERMLEALGRRFRASGEPRGLQLVHPFGVGNQGDRGLERMAHPAMFRRVIGGHWSMSPTMARLAAQNLFEAYCLPAGVLVQLFHAAAAASPGYLTEIGLHTFIDPRLEGGKLNPAAREDLVELVVRGGKEYLFYPAIPIDVALIKAAAADTQGNLSMREEVAPWHNLALAQAARANGGITIAQVKRVVEAGTLDPREVRVPGIFVDYLIVDPAHGMTYEIFYDPALAGDARKPESEFPPFAFSLRKVVARRAAMELQPGAVLNVGFGMPDGVIKVAREQGFAGQFVPTIEQGQIGGIPAEGLEFGAAYNATAIVETGQQFAFYHGRGVDLAFLGFAEVDAAGNVNVSKLGEVIIGVGGFIDISQKARKVVFCGALAIQGRFSVAGGGLRSEKPGAPKFVPRVRQVTFSGSNARRTGQEVLYVTEAAVFRLTPEGVRLEEIAPGLDLERDILPQLGFRPLIREPLGRMAPELFGEAPLPAALFAQFEVGRGRCG